MSDVRLDTKVPWAGGCCAGELRLTIPRRRHPVLDEDEHKEQQALIDHEKPGLDAAQQPNERLHQAYPKKVVQLIAANTAHRDT